jgi:excisionase family DNA binding protein
VRGILAMGGTNGTIHHMASELIDTTEAGKALNVTRRQVLNFISDGLLPAQRIGSGFVIRRSDLKLVPKVRKRGPKAKGKK